MPMDEEGVTARLSKCQITQGSSKDHELVKATSIGDVDEVRRLLLCMTTDQWSDRSIVETKPAAPVHAPFLAAPPTQSAFGLTLQSQAVMGSVAIWPAAAALCEYLLSHSNLFSSGANVIEIGAGAGAPGLLTAVHSANKLLLTDSDPELIRLLDSNHSLNLKNIQGKVSTGLLDWNDAAHLARYSTGHRMGNFDLVLAADVLFSAGNVGPLARAAASLLRLSAHARILLSRSDYFESFDPMLLAGCEELGLECVKKVVFPSHRACVMVLGWENCGVLARWRL